MTNLKEITFEVNIPERTLEVEGLLVKLDESLVDAEKTPLDEDGERALLLKYSKSSLFMRDMQNIWSAMFESNDPKFYKINVSGGEITENGYKSMVALDGYLDANIIE